MDNSKKLSSSLEDYLEAILILEKQNRVARVKDISEHLSVQMPSVTGALRTLKKRGMIAYEKNSYIYLTEEGLEIAECILNRHNIILQFFNEVLDLEGAWVENQACGIEHLINRETSKRLEHLTLWIKDNVFDKMGISKKEWLEILRKEQ